MSHSLSNYAIHLVLRHLGEAAGNFEGPRLARKNGMNWVMRGGWYHLFMLNHPILRFLPVVVPISRAEA